MIKSFRTIAFAAFALASVIANAQNGVNSPYSRYGFGLMSDRSMGFNKGMGGIAQGYRDGQSINTANPASYSACDSLTALFDLGMSFQNGNYSMGGLQQNAKNTSFDYAAFHFRAWRGVGVAVAILPVTNIGYSFTSQSETLSGSENITSSYSFSGTGGLHQVVLGAGWRIFKPLSIGANISYLYGDYSHSMSMAFSSTSVNTVARNYTADISTYSLDLGLQYTQPISKTDRFTLGATYTLGHDINNSAYRTTTNANTSSSTTLSTVDTLRNAFQLPYTIAAGIAYYHGMKLTVGADFELQKWSNVRFPNQAMTTTNSSFAVASGMFNDKMKVAAGLAYTPNVFSKHYGNRITYKVGGYYSKTYANTDASLSSKPYEYGVSAGVSLPISNRNTQWAGSTPKINLTFQWVHTNVPYISAANAAQSTLSENYLKLCLGITFSDRWFYKWKAK